MAEITKKLKLIAELDDKKVRRQVSELKKELNKLKIKEQDLSGFDRSIKTLRDAARELRAAVSQFRKISPGRINAISGGTARRSGSAPGVVSGRSQEMRTILDMERLRSVNLKGSQVYSQTIGRKFQNEKQKMMAEREFKIRTAETITKLEEKSRVKMFENQKRLTAQEERRKERIATNTAAAMGRQMGLQMPVARAGSQLLSDMLPGGITGIGRAARLRAIRMGRSYGLSNDAIRSGLGFGGMALKGLGAAGLGVAALGMGASAFAGGAQSSRELRNLVAQRSQQPALDVMEGNALQSRIRQTARTQVKGDIAEGISQTLSDLFSVRGFTSAITGKSFRKGRIKTAFDEEATQLQENRLGLEAMNTARSLRDPRLDALRGGGYSGNLSVMQAMGVGNGFMPQETIQQFLEARQFIGNKGAGQNIGTFQDMLNRTGTSIADQARATEILTGAGRGDFGSGAQKTVEVLKKGVAAGLDVSKAGQFLKVTADFVTQTQGFGKTDVDFQSTRLAQLSAGFAGGGEVTATQLNQAKNLAQMQRKESMGGGSLAQLGKMSVIQDVLGENMTSEQFMQALQVSSTDDPAQVAKALNISEEQAAELINKSAGAVSEGQKVIGGTGVGRYLAAKERGISLGEQVGIEDAERVAKTVDVSGGILPDIERGSPEFQSKLADAQAEQIKFVSGMEAMNINTKATTESLDKLKTQLDEAVNALGKFNEKAKEASRKSIMSDLQSVKVIRQSGGGGRSY